MPRKELLPPQVRNKRKQDKENKSYREKLYVFLITLFFQLGRLLKNPGVWLTAMILFAFLPTALANPTTPRVRRSNNQAGGILPIKSTYASMPPVLFDEKCTMTKEESTIIATHVGKSWQKIQNHSPFLIPALEAWTKSNNSHIKIDCTPQKEKSLSFDEGYFDPVFNRVGIFFHQTGKEEYDILLREETFHAAAYEKFKQEMKFFSGQEQCQQFLTICKQSMARLLFIAHHSGNTISNNLYYQELNNQFIEKDYYQKIVSVISTVEFNTIMLVPQHIAQMKEFNNPAAPYNIKIVTVHGEYETHGVKGTGVTAILTGNEIQRINALAEIIKRKLQNMNSYYSKRFKPYSDAYYVELSSFFVGELFIKQEFAQALLPEFYAYFQQIFPQQNTENPLMDLSTYEDEKVHTVRLDGRY